MILPPEPWHLNTLPRCTVEHSLLEEDYSRAAPDCSLEGCTRVESYLRADCTPAESYLQVGYTSVESWSRADCTSVAGYLPAAVSLSPMEGCR